MLLREPTEVPKERLEQLVQVLKEKVPSHHFDKTHSFLDHSLELCPKGDLFLTPGALNTAELKEDLMAMEESFAPEDPHMHEDL